MERRAIKIRLYPNREQETLINKSLGADRWIYNRALYLKKKRYEEFKENLSWVEISKMVTLWKKTEELAWLKEPARSVLENSLRKLDTAYRNFFKNERGFPKFKKKGEYNSFVLSDESQIISNNSFKLPKMGVVKIKGLRKFEGKIKNVTISKTPSGKYFASFSVEDVVKIVKTANEKIVGIDVNLENFLTDSNGNRVENPKFKKNVFNKIKFYQRKLSKSKKGSKNREYWRLKINRVYEKINNKKQNFLNNLSKKYVENQDIIIVEDLKISNMVKNHKLAESISNVSWGEFFRQLEYKSKWYGTRFIKIDPKFTSRTCSNCGSVNSELTLSDRMWTCSGCNTVLNRDFNSATNIKKKGISSILKTCGDIGSIQVYETGNYSVANTALASV